MNRREVFSQLSKISTLPFFCYLTPSFSIENKSSFVIEKNNIGNLVCKNTQFPFESFEILIDAQIVDPKYCYSSSDVVIFLDSLFPTNSNYLFIRAEQENKLDYSVVQVVEDENKNKKLRFIKLLNLTSLDKNNHLLLSEYDEFICPFMPMGQKNSQNEIGFLFKDDFHKEIKVVYLVKNNLEFEWKKTILSHSEDFLQNKIFPIPSILNTNSNIFLLTSEKDKIYQFYQLIHSENEESSFEKLGTLEHNYVFHSQWKFQFQMPAEWSNTDIKGDEICFAWKYDFESEKCLLWKTSDEKLAVTAYNSLENYFECLAISTEKFLPTDFNFYGTFKCYFLNNFKDVLLFEEIKSRNKFFVTLEKNSDNQWEFKKIKIEEDSQVHFSSLYHEFEINFSDENSTVSIVSAESQTDNGEHIPFYMIGQNDSEAHQSIQFYSFYKTKKNTFEIQLISKNLDSQKSISRQNQLSLTAGNKSGRSSILASSLRTSRRSLQLMSNSLFRSSQRFYSSMSAHFQTNQTSPWCEEHADGSIIVSGKKYEALDDYFFSRLSDCKIPLSWDADNYKVRDQLTRIQGKSIRERMEFYYENILQGNPADKERFFQEFERILRGVQVLSTDSFIFSVLREKNFEYIEEHNKLLSSFLKEPWSQSGNPDHLQLAKHYYYGDSIFQPDWSPEQLANYFEPHPWYVNRIYRPLPLIAGPISLDWRLKRMKWESSFFKTLGQDFLARAVKF